MSTRCRSKVVSTGVALVATALAACSESTANDDELSRQEVLDQAVAELVAMPGGPPGAIVVVQRDADRSVHPAGVAELGSDAAPGVEDKMRIASVAKAFSGATVLSLVDEGVLSLDDTIADRLPELPEAWGRVTLRQLLSHTSGLPDYTGKEAWGEALLASTDEAPTPAGLLAFVAEDPLDFAPGTQYRYSNSDNIVAALMAEAVTGQPYADVLAEHVLEPLGLDDTSLPTGTEMPEPFIHGYETEDDGRLRDVSTLFDADWPWASGGIVSTPADLNDFIRSYVDGELFGDDVRDQQQELFIPAGGSEPRGPGDNSASMALFRYQTECGTVYGHTGNFFGYTQFVAASRDGQRSVAAAISARRTQNDQGQAASVFTALQRLWEAAICYALE